MLFFLSLFLLSFLPSAASEVICRLQSSEPSALLPMTTSFAAAAGVAVFDRGDEAMAAKKKSGDDDEERRCLKGLPRGCCCRLCCLLCGGEKGLDGLDEEAMPPRGSVAIRGGGSKVLGRREKRIEARGNEEEWICLRTRGRKK